MQLEPVIGLEIHVQLKTKSKMFCPCDNTGEDKPANTTICPVCLGHPGTLPVPNGQAIRMAVRAALALHLKVNQRSKFDRKNYFYPDLPKGYQISQYDEPLAQTGYLDIETSQRARRIGIERLHLEEDTAKLLHAGDKSLVDFNRAGTPLMEIVSQPDIETPEEARVFLQDLRLIMRYLDVSEADMEKGHLRCDANISLRPAGESQLYPKTEIKNLNSFRSVERALAYEVKRQTELWQHQEMPKVTSTRGWDEGKGETVAQREKEAVHDYRYFPEPDIPPVVIAASDLKVWQEELPELPADRRKRFMASYDLKPADARLLTEDKRLGDFTEAVVVELAGELDGDITSTAKLAVNWIVHKLVEVLREQGKTLATTPVSVSNLVSFLKLVARRQVNSSNAQVLLRRMVETGKDPLEIVESEDLGQSGDTGELGAVVTRVLADNPKQAQELKAGKSALFKFFVGLVMKQTKGKADPEAAEAWLKKAIGS